MLHAELACPWLAVAGLRQRVHRFAPLAPDRVRKNSGPGIAGFAMSYLSRSVKGAPKSGGPSRENTVGDFAVRFLPSSDRIP